MRLSRSAQTRIASFASRFGGLLVSLIGKSLRLEIRGWNRVQSLLEKNVPIVLQVWHGEMFMVWHVVSPLKPAAIISEAGDGDIASAVLRGMDYVTFRGSSTRGGRKAYFSMIKYLKKQKSPVAAFASDGPKGPRYVLKPGTLVAAQHLDGVLIPVATVSKWELRARSWDKFSIPLPFSKSIVSFGEPIRIDKTLKGDAFDEKLKLVSERCKKYQEELFHAFD